MDNASHMRFLLAEASNVLTYDVDEPEWAISALADLKELLEKSNDLDETQSDKLSKATSLITAIKKFNTNIAINGQT